MGRGTTVRYLAVALATAALTAAALVGVTAPASAVTCGSGAMTLTVNITTSPTTVQLPLSGTVTNISVDWGDSTTTGPYNSPLGSLPSHSYTTLGPHTISIDGTALTGYGVPGSGFYDGSDTITSVTNWGGLGLTSLESAFLGAVNLTAVPTCLPSAVTNLSNMFSGATLFNQNVSGWDTSAVTDMSYLFYSAAEFNQPLNAWDTSGVTNMSGMFFQSGFNQPIGAWNTGKVTDMSFMFYQSVFNQPIGAWNTSKVTDMHSMFHSAADFDQPLSSWDTSSVEDMSGMFSDADVFDQPLGSWNTRDVRSMSGMFSRADVFNQPIGTWDTSRVTDMYLMFAGAVTFNQPLSAWNTSSVTDMTSMFSGAATFDQPLTTWNTSEVTDMGGMFTDAVAFDQPLSSWNTSNVREMSRMLDGTRLSVANYDSTLAGWAGRAETDGVNLGAVGLLYGTTGEAAKDSLTTLHTWTFTGDSAATAPMMRAVSVTGTPVVRGILTVTPPRVTQRPTLSYQWQASATGTSGWVAIPGARGSTYTVPDSQAGRFLRVVVVAANGVAPSATQTSARTAVVARAAPSAPRSVAASPRNASAVVTWQLPSSTGGAPLTEYMVTATSARKPTRTCSTSTTTSVAPARSCTVTGLTNASTYSFTVVARNTFGTTVRTSLESAAASAVVGTATAPRSLAVACPAVGTARVTWLTPSFVGSGAITGYRVRWYDTVTKAYTPWVIVSATARAATVTGRVKSRGYTVQVQARNGSGWGLVAAKTFSQTT